jgi:hypothetical protein
MRLEIRIERMQFLATRAPEPKTDQEGRQKRDQRTQEPLWQTELVALDADGAEVIRVSTAFEPKVTPGQYVQVGELVASPWSMGDRSGVAYRAQKLAAMQPVQPAATHSRATS